MNLEIPELHEVLEKINELENFIKGESAQSNLKAEFYNDEQVAALKGINISTYRSNSFFQIKGGKPDGKVGGRKVWTRESVIEWLPLNDEQMEEYNRKYKTGHKRKRDDI